MPERAVAAPPARPQSRNLQFPPRPGRILGLDYGAKNIGVAVGNTVTATAQALTKVAARDGVPDWRQLQKHIDNWRPAALAVGLPLNMDGSESEMAKRARAFGRHAGRRFGLAVEFVDERLTTRAAEELLQAAAEAAGRAGKLDRLRRQKRDCMAAELIVRAYLAEASRATAPADG